MQRTQGQVREPQCGRHRQMCGGHHRRLRRPTRPPSARSRVGSLERARATGYFAALTIAEDDPRRTSATSVAKAAAGDCQRLIAKEGIQIHGGIGYTWEHDMHLYVKRMKSGEQLFGTSADHRARLASMLGV